MSMNDMSRYTTLAHLEEDAANLRNNYDGSDLDAFCALMKRYQNKRLELLGLRGCIL